MNLYSTFLNLIFCKQKTSLVFTLVTFYNTIFILCILIFTIFSLYRANSHCEEQRPTKFDRLEMQRCFNSWKNRRFWYFSVLDLNFLQSSILSLIFKI